MNFKDALVKDLSQVFFNVDEFAELVIIDGKPMTVIIDTETLKKHNLKQGKGLNTGELLYIVKKSEMENEPIIDNRCTFNGKSYTIKDFSEDDLTYTVMLEARRS